MESESKIIFYKRIAIELQGGLYSEDEVLSKLKENLRLSKRQAKEALIIAKEIFYDCIELGILLVTKNNEEFKLKVNEEYESIILSFKIAVFSLIDLL